MADPTSITFDDDIVMCIKAEIRRSKAVSHTHWEVFSQFPKVLAKNKDSLGNLLDATNNYLQFGAAALATEQYKHLILVIVQMAKTALFTTHTNVTLNNAEGAILLQVLLQFMRGTNALDDILFQLLHEVKVRSAMAP